MKKVLLSSFVVLCMTLTVFAYETIIIKFPEYGNWKKAYYEKRGLEAIVQYTPSGQSHHDWTETVVVHSYNHSTYPIQTFLTNSITRMEKANPTGEYKYRRLTNNDGIVTRCTYAYNNIPSQCEIFRGTMVHGGIISVHYINKNKRDFMANYDEWYNIIKNAKYYNSYYRDDRILDKAEFFEL